MQKSEFYSENTAEFSEHIVLELTLSRRLISLSGKGAGAFDLGENAQMATLQISTANIKQEANRLKNTLNRIDFFRANYKASIDTLENNYPEHEEFKKLAAIAPKWGKVDVLKQLLLVVEDEYDEGYFDNAKIVAERGRSELIRAFDTFALLERNWGFNYCDNYIVTLYRYGFHAGYLASDMAGFVSMGCRRSGDFAPSSFVARAIHEMVHIGIEEKIVKKYSLSHWEKERVVDNICKKVFSAQLPGYKYQPARLMGVERMDEYLGLDVIMHNLPKAIETYFGYTKDNFLLVGNS